MDLMSQELETALKDRVEDTAGHKEDQKQRCEREPHKESERACLCSWHRGAGSLPAGRPRRRRHGSVGRRAVGDGSRPGSARRKRRVDLDRFAGRGWEGVGGVHGFSRWSGSTRPWLGRCVLRGGYVRGERPGTYLLVSLNSTVQAFGEGPDLTHATRAQDGCLSRQRAHGDRKIPVHR